MQLKLARNDAGGPEIFRSIQGEGRNAGRVRTFIRLSGCNLHCVWCDTAYTWNWFGSDFVHERDEPSRPHKFDPATEMEKLSVEDAVARIRELPSEGVVVTGGEPLMQREALVALIDALKVDNPDLQVEIETNGSIAPGDALSRRVDLFTVSPKLRHSGNDPAIALNRAALAAFAGDEKAAFKFVARTPDDVAAVATLAAELNIPPSRIYVMPEGVTSQQLHERGRLLVGPVLAHGFNFTDRLHIHLFGAARGV
jgi:7-carboxy-7-deazaguanine synthase